MLTRAQRAGGGRPPADAHARRRRLGAVGGLGPRGGLEVVLPPRDDSTVTGGERAICCPARAHGLLPRAARTVCDPLLGPGVPHAAWGG